MTLVGRTAAVTGSFGAIGSAVSKALTELGAHVVAIDVADTASSSTNDRITPLHLDLSDASAIAAAASELTKTFGSIDILANNAGVLSNNKAQGLGLRDRQAINDAQSASCSGSPPCDHHARDAARRGGVRVGLSPRKSTRQEAESSSHEERRPGREQTTARILLHGPTVGRLRFQPSRPAPSLPHQAPNEHGENAGIPSASTPRRVSRP